MAIKALEFEKKWTNPTDFPTYEPDEEQVRADLQYHPNAIAAYINETLKGELEKAAEAGGNAEKHIADSTSHVTADEKAAWDGKVTISRTEPSRKDVLWIDIGNNGVGKYWNGTAWVSIAAVSASVATAIPVLSQDPASTVLGQVWVVE